MLMIRLMHYVVRNPDLVTCEQPCTDPEGGPRILTLSPTDTPPPPPPLENQQAIGCRSACVSNQRLYYSLLESVITIKKSSAKIY